MQKLKEKTTIHKEEKFLVYSEQGIEVTLTVRSQNNKRVEQFLDSNLLNLWFPKKTKKAMLIFKAFTRTDYFPDIHGLRKKTITTFDTLDYKNESFDYFNEFSKNGFDINKLAVVYDYDLMGVDGIPINRPRFVSYRNLSSDVAAPLFDYLKSHSWVQELKEEKERNEWLWEFDSYYHHISFWVTLPDQDYSILWSRILDATNKNHVAYQELRSCFYLNPHNTLKIDILGIAPFFSHYKNKKWSSL